MTRLVIIVAIHQRDLTDIEKVFARRKLFATLFRKKNGMESFSAEITALMSEEELKS
jgi:hypothetical protein